MKNPPYTHLNLIYKLLIASLHSLAFSIFSRPDSSLPLSLSLHLDWPVNCGQRRVIVNYYLTSCQLPCSGSLSHQKNTMGPRWKGNGAAAKALADLMSTIVSQLQSSLVQSNSRGLFSGSSLLLEANVEQTDLLNRVCFGKPVISAQKDNQWFQFSYEEAFYLCYSLKCINVVDENQCEMNVEQLWKYMVSKKENFPSICKAYFHLRSKNWVVRSGSQYGVDFVAYRHHPALVHSEYAVLVLSSEAGNENDRLRVWSDYHSTLRLCGSVAKTLLVLYVKKTKLDLPANLDSYIIEERTVTRWSPEQCREDKLVKI